MEELGNRKNMWQPWLEMVHVMDVTFCPVFLNPHQPSSDPTVFNLFFVSIALCSLPSHSHFLLSSLDQSLSPCHDHVSFNCFDSFRIRLDSSDCVELTQSKSGTCISCTPNFREEEEKKSLRNTN